MQQPNAAVAVMLCQVNQQKHKGIFGGHCVAVGVSGDRLGPLPRIAVVGGKILVIGGHQALMQFHINAARSPPDILMVALRALCKPHLHHKGADTVILLRADENVNVAHGTQFRSRIELFQRDALEWQVVHILPVKAVEDALCLAKLVLLHCRAAHSVLTEIQKALGIAGVTGIYRAVIQQGCGLLLFAQAIDRAPVAVLRQRLMPGQDAVSYERQNNFLKLCHWSLTSV